MFGEKIDEKGIKVKLENAEKYEFPRSTMDPSNW